MSHAEKCPVCDGSGCTDDRIEPRIIIDCHGCDGKGWVEVGSDRVGVPVPWPVYLSPDPKPGPIITVGPWVYETGTYSANVEVNIKGL